MTCYDAGGWRWMVMHVRSTAIKLKLQSKVNLQMKITSTDRHWALFNKIAMQSNAILGKESEMA
jgi:hypothetical protein